MCPHKPHLGRRIRRKKPRTDEKAKDAVTKAAHATDEVVEVVGHIPAAVLATWGVDSNWGKVFGGSRPTQRTSRKRPPLTARRGIHSGSQAAAFRKLSLKFLHGG